MITALKYWSVIVCVLWFSLSALVSRPASAQPEPFKWGEVSDEEISLTSFPDDPAATAVILADYGSLEFDFRDYELDYKQLRRVKILNESGYDWGTVQYLYWDKSERIKRVEAQVLKKDASGEIVRTELDDKDIYTEDVYGNLKRMRFALPGLEPGAIIEFRIESSLANMFMLPSWRFQANEPIVWSEYRMEVPEGFKYVLVTTGSTDYHIADSQRRARSGMYRVRYRWVMKDVPALRDEPMMTSVENYYASLRFQLKSFEDFFGDRPIVATWQSLTDELVRRSDYRDFLQPGGYLTDLARQLVGDSQDDHAKLHRLYEHVRGSVEWDGSRRYTPDKSPREVLETTSGSSAEINLTLVGLARAAGFIADPVLLSTRKNGKVITGHPFLDQFDYVIAGVMAGGDIHLLDATDRHRPADVLPSRALNELGFLAKESFSTWIPIENHIEDDRKIRVSATLSPDGSVSGMLQVTHSGYAALESRDRIAELGEEKYVMQSLFASDDVTLGSYQVLNKDSLDAPLQLVAEFSAPSYAQLAGDFLYVNPILVDRLTESPFRAQSRQFPIDFTYPRKSLYQLQLRLPEGYELIEVPPDSTFGMPDGSAVCTHKTTLQNGLAVYHAYRAINRTKYDPSEYPAIRSFYDQLIAEHGAHLVLKRQRQTGTSEGG